MSFDVFRLGRLPSRPSRAVPDVLDTWPVADDGSTTPWDLLEGGSGRQVESLWETSLLDGLCGVVMPVPLLLVRAPSGKDSSSLEVSKPPTSADGLLPWASMDSPVRGSVSDHTLLSWECAWGRDGRRRLPGNGSEESVVPELKEARAGEEGGDGRMEVWREDGWRGRCGRGGCGWNLTVDLASSAMGGDLGAGAGGVAGAACGSRCILSALGAGAGMAVAAVGRAAVGAWQRTVAVQGMTNTVLLFAQQTTLEHGSRHNPRLRAVSHYKLQPYSVRSTNLAHRPPERQNPMHAIPDRPSIRISDLSPRSMLIHRAQADITAAKKRETGGDHYNKKSSQSR